MSPPATQTSFSSGEIDPLLAGRIDIRAAQEGCRTLRNLLVQLSGGLTRRPGTRIVRQLQGADRLLTLDLPSGPVVLALSGGRLEVLENDATYTVLTATWTTAQIAALRSTHRGAALLLAHPDLETLILSRDASGVWTLQPLPWAQTTDSFPLTRKPFFRFADPDVSIQPSFGTQALTDPIAMGCVATIRTSKPVFTAAHLNTRLRIRGRQVTILNIVSPVQASGRADQGLIDGQATYDWQEEAFSNAHGWPVTLAIFQDRLVVGGSRDLRAHIWLSRTGAHFDFDPGTGLDDESINFQLAGDGRQDISALVASRQLQVLTAAGEWVVRGVPVTPTSIQAELQTSIGSLAQPAIQPLSIDGATLFIGATGRDLREFLYTDAEQAYQAADLAILCRHLLTGPVDMAFDPGRRILCIVRSDGRMATVTIDRTSNIAAWSLQEIAGKIRAVATAANAIYLAIEFNGRVLLERFDDSLALDHVVAKTTTLPSVSWGGLDLLVGQPVVAMSGSRIIAEQLLTGTTLITPEACLSLDCGIRFGHIVEALPVTGGSDGGSSLNALYRVLGATFRVNATNKINADVGNGPRQLASPAATGLADLELAGLGWRRSLDGPPWRITGDDPSSFTLLATTLDIKVNS